VTSKGTLAQQLSVVQLVTKSRSDLERTFVPPGDEIEARARIAETQQIMRDIELQMLRRTDADDGEWRGKARRAKAWYATELHKLGLYLQTARAASASTANSVAQAPRQTDAEESCRRLVGEVERLTEETDRLRGELARLASETVVTRLAGEFVEVARIVLGEQTFNRIYARARDRVTAKGGSK
jgi:hypothetical protein